MVAWHHWLNGHTCVHAKSLQSCHVGLFANLWTVAHHAPLSTEWEYWSGLPLPSPGESSQPRDWICISCLLHWQAGSLPLAPPGKPMDMSLSKLWETVKDREVGHAAVHGVARCQTRLSDWTKGELQKFPQANSWHYQSISERYKSQKQTLASSPNTHTLSKTCFNNLASNFSFVFQEILGNQI